ncbi:type VI secretion system protein TssA [Pseudomonas sp. S31]|uniref:type VI secretion system protein TssA n=1 Tax=Pseudomonas sp. S31 TaxID=1564473 RepID=UPI0019147B5A|nr:type VI secretion system protein TssA [Pseudomonas sp. S31]MBK4998175.1 type VI secretion system protein TssA [Pseudomonas sp. S31]
MSLVAQVSAQEIRRLLAPVDPQMPAGLFDMEDETYQAIDQEMVKLGGLQESSIDWSYIEEASRQYLASQCKHLRIVGHLSVAWLRSRCWQNWGFTLELLAGMMEQYWECAHPKPGPKGLLGKRKLVGLIINRLLDALPRLDRFTYSCTHAAVAQEALASLRRQSEAAQLDEAALGELERLMLRHLESAESGDDATAMQAVPKIEPAPLLDLFAAPKASLSLGNERETRRAVLSMAEFINQQDPYDPAGYQLRRFGLWAHLHAAPAARQDNRTELMAVPLDIARVYEDAIVSTSIAPALLLRIEKSVTSSPYWIRGSYLASTVAARLSMDEVAEAIRSTTARFVLRMPALQQLCFSDGTAFVDGQCLAWLRGRVADSDQPSAGREFASLREELTSQLESSGVEPVLLHLQGMQADLLAPRERCHSTIIAADLLAARGISWLAQDLCASVAQTMQQTTADAWEPDVFQRLQHYGATSALLEKNRE